MGNARAIAYRPLETDGKIHRHSKRKINHASHIILAGSGQCHLDWWRLGRSPARHRRCRTIVTLIVGWICGLVIDEWPVRHAAAGMQRAPISWPRYHSPWENLPHGLPFGKPGGLANTFAVQLAANQNKQKETGTIIMTTLEVKGDWNITKGKLKQKWAKLTDSDLQYAEGKQ